MTPAGGVLCAGNYLVDILTRPVDAIRWNATVWVDSIEQSIGGNGASTASALARLGVRARAIGALGPDPFGAFVRAALNNAGVDTALLETVQAPTAATTVLVREDGARALLHRPGASALAFPEPLDFPSAITAGCRRFHLGNPFGLPLMRRHAGETLRRARLAGLATSMDTGWDARGEWLSVAGPAFEHLDLLFVNQDEARMLAGTDHPTAAARFFLDRGVGMAVIKLGAEGCAVFTTAGELRQPAFRVPVVDTTGAGDCFAGAFLAGLEKGWDLARTAQIACAVGALNVQCLGATCGLRSEPETLRWIAAQPPQC